MSSSTIEAGGIVGTSVSLTPDVLTVGLSDGRTISVPLAWYPRLLHATVAERDHWQFIGQGVGVHWPELDEDLRIEDMIEGRKSRESQRSLGDWLAQRRALKGVESGASELPDASLPLAQSILSENWEPLRISNLDEDEVGYVVPWAIAADEEGRVWIDGDTSFQREPHGTKHVVARRSGAFIVVDRSSIGGHHYERRAIKMSECWIPVAFR